MKTFLSRATVVAVALAICLVTLQARAQTRPSGTSVAVIDLGEVFKAHPRLKTQLEGIKTQIDAYEAFVRQEQTKVQAMAEELKTLKAGTPTYADKEKAFASALAIDSDTAESKRQKRLATVGKARCLAETGSPGDGVKMIEQIIADNDASDAVLFGRAYNAQGDCLRKLEKTKDALMAYLHVDVLFYSDPDVHAESLYHLSKLWSDIGKSDRAVAARNLLDERYPGSIWSRKE